MFAASLLLDMELSALILFAGALLINAGSPGPSIAALVARVVTRGIGSVLPFLAAMWIGELLWLALAVGGLSYVAERFFTVFAILKYCGVAYLLYLAWKMWTATVAAEGAAIPEADSALRLFLTGMALTLGNPKIMVFYLALLPALIDLSSIGPIGLIELLAVALAVMMFVDLVWAFAADWARRWIRSARAMRIANRTSATAMGGAALVIATR
jgi:threonine/homoserine/homoserine lactone efflux protein